MAGTGSTMESIAHEFVDAFNRRDAAGLVALVDPEFEFHPTVLVGSRRTYHGTDGLLGWTAELQRSAMQHQARVLDVRVLDEYRFLALAEVLVGGKPISPSAMLARVNEQGMLVEVHAYLSDEQTLREIGITAIAERLRDDTPLLDRGLDQVA
jgi:SnoaL-like domain